MITEPQVTISGRYKITVTDSKTGEVKRQSKWIKNMVMNDGNKGIRVFVQHLLNNKSNTIHITTASIGTDATAPDPTDADLYAPVATGIIVSNKANLGTIAQFDFFITDAQLANGTYREFGIFTGANLFARSIISPEFTKASGEDTTVTYQVTFGVV